LKLTFNYYCDKTVFFWKSKTFIRVLLHLKVSCDVKSFEGTHIITSTILYNVYVDYQVKTFPVKNY